MIRVTTVFFPQYFCIVRGLTFLFRFCARKLCKMVSGKTVGSAFFYSVFFSVLVIS